MSKIKVTLDAQKELRGEDDTYREDVEIFVEQDTENEEQLKFDINYQEFFIKKEDIKALTNLFKIE